MHEFIAIHKSQMRQISKCSQWPIWLKFDFISWCGWDLGQSMELIHFSQDRVICSDGHGACRYLLKPLRAWLCYTCFCNWKWCRKGWICFKLASTVMICILPMALLSSERQNDWHSFTAVFLVSNRDLPGHGHSHGGGRIWERFVGWVSQV